MDQWITFEVKIEKYENLLSLDQMTMIGDYISALAKVTRCVNLKVDCFIKFAVKWCFINRHWTWCQLILAIRTTNEGPARSQSFSNFPYKGKYEASKTTQNGSVLTHHPLWTCHGTFVSQMSSYIHFHAPPHLILLQMRKMVVWCCILLTHSCHSDAQSDFKSILF